MQKVQATAVVHDWHGLTQGRQALTEKYSVEVHWMQVFVGVWLNPETHAVQLEAEVTHAEHGEVHGAQIDPLKNSEEAHGAKQVFRGVRL
jgi:hypothetical protein